MLEMGNVTKSPSYAFIDALHNETCTGEADIYFQGCEKLYQQLCEKHPAMTQAMIIAHNQSAKRKLRITYKPL